MMATQTALTTKNAENPSALMKKLTHLETTPIFSSESKNWRGFGVSKLRLPPGSYPEQFVTDHYFAVQLNNSVKIEVELNGRRHTGRFFKGDVTYAPPGVWCRSSWDQERELLIVSLDSSFVNARTKNFLQPETRQLVPQFRLRDPLLEGIAHALGAEASGDKSATLNFSGAENSYAESLAEVLVAHVIKDYSSTAPSEQLPPGKLTPLNLRRATDFINESLEGELALADIAGAVGMSQFHFARMFKQTTGYTPLQYVMEQKIERAKRFLKDDEMALVDIAFRLGFASQSHFTAHFRRLTGTTPKHFRGSL